MSCHVISGPKQRNRNRHLSLGMRSLLGERALIRRIPASHGCYAAVIGPQIPEPLVRGETP